MTQMKPRQEAGRVLAILEQVHADACIALNFTSPLELLVATILSAQCTDVRVNLVTRDLFRKYPHARAYAEADLDQLEQDIRSTGFFRNKAKSLIGCASALIERHGGEVPQTMEELTALPGVGRKTANVVLGNAFGVPGMVVDTHVGRVATRLGWTRERDPGKIERDLCRLLPKEKWTWASHVLIFHGRRICKAPVPLCSTCPVFELCPRIGVNKSK
ncbi:MAG TPA: endonuclease III [Desulfuromonadales bacterium]|nr:endonuclease III [Desulfuromonadales bacterium]